MVPIDTDSRVAQIPGQLATPEAPNPARRSLISFARARHHLPGGRPPRNPTAPASVCGPLTVGAQIPDPGRPPGSTPAFLPPRRCAIAAAAVWQTALCRLPDRRCPHYVPAVATRSVLG